MPNCDTRPVSWRIIQNEALIRAIGEVGFEADRMWVGLLTWRDNLGYFDGSPAILRDCFFAAFPAITVAKAQEIRNALQAEGLIIVYWAMHREFILIPKVGSHNKLVGHMSDKSIYPACPQEAIEAWEQRFKDVYTLPIRRLNVVQPEGEVEGKDKGKDKGESEGRSGNQKSHPYTFTECRTTLVKAMECLEVRGKTTIAETFCKGMKARTRCGDLAACAMGLQKIAGNVKRKAPKDAYPYLEGAIRNTLEGK